MQKYFLFGIVGIFVGVFLSQVFMGPHEIKKTAPVPAAIQKQDHSSHNTENMTMDAQMKNMNASLKGKTGDAFDKAFLSEMIVHHQGAIDMANMAIANSSHEELKNLAQDIITAQTDEIAQMRKWQKEWGYEK